MTKQELEVKIDALKLSIKQSDDITNNYTSELSKLEKQLADLNKPKLTDEQFDELMEAIETGIGNYDFSDTDNYSIDYGIDYDGRVHCESFDFDNADDLAREIYEYVARLFAETEDDNQENQD
tara:strand:- start:618 stop:986 length:369 start_codon:yes stop_codon:yes gene_type:complete